jgi:hypothetical protein
MSEPVSTRTTPETPEASDWDRAAFDMIVRLRGGHPEKCDFFEQPYTETRCPIPEEAGEWTCSECWARWEKEAT